MEKSFDKEEIQKNIKLIYSNDRIKEQTLKPPKLKNFENKSYFTLQKSQPLQIEKQKPNKK